MSLNVDRDHLLAVMIIYCKRAKSFLNNGFATMFESSTMAMNDTGYLCHREYFVHEYRLSRDTGAPFAGVSAQENP